MSEVKVDCAFEANVQQSQSGWHLSYFQKHEVTGTLFYPWTRWVTSGNVGASCSDNTLAMTWKIFVENSILFEFVCIIAARK